MIEKMIDYSQWASWKSCQLLWYEKYRNQIRREIKGQKADAMTLGSLVHDGLQNYRETGQCLVRESAINEHDPTPECLAWAQELLLGYFRGYSNEDFTQYYCEEPLRFPLHPEMDGLAKVDCYFRLEEARTIESGIGDSFALEPGIWIHEYKTKAASKDTGKYLASWRMNMQANFQMLALQAKLGEPVKGLFVNVLEKPADYQPKRTCKECKAVSELRNWEPTGTGYCCPACSNIQDLDTSVKTKIKRVPAYYRFMVTRTASELAMAKTEINQVALQILDIDAGIRVPERSTEKCVDQIWGACDYFEPHSAEQTAENWSGFVKVESLRYVTR